MYLQRCNSGQCHPELPWYPDPNPPECCQQNHYRHPELQSTKTSQFAHDSKDESADQVYGKDDKDGVNKRDEKVRVT